MRAVYLLVMLELGWIVGGMTNGGVTTDNISIFDPQAQSQNREEANETANVEEANAYIEVATQFSEGVSNVLSDTKMTKLTKIFESAPMLGAVMGFVSIFVTDSTTLALNQIKDKLEDIDGQLTALSLKIDSLENTVKLEHFLTRIATDYSKINAAHTAYRSFVAKNSPHNRDHIKDFYADYELLKRPILSLYENVNGEGITGNRLSDQLYDATAGHYMDIFAFYMRIQTVIARGIAVWTLGCQLSEGEDCVEHGYQLMGPHGKEYHKTFSTNFQDTLRKCRENYENNRQKEIDTLTWDNRAESNKNMADIIGNFVRAKYFWKDQTVLVYNAEEKYCSLCLATNGYTRQNHHEKSVVILDSDVLPNPFNPLSYRTVPYEFMHPVNLFENWNTLDFYNEAMRAKNPAQTIQDKLMRRLSNTDKDVPTSKTAIVISFLKRKWRYGSKAGIGPTVKTSTTELGWSLGKNGVYLGWGGAKGQAYESGSTAIVEFDAYFNYFLQLDGVATTKSKNHLCYV